MGDDRLSRALLQRRPARAMSTVAARWCAAAEDRAPTARRGTHALSQWKAERVGRRGSHRARAVEADAELVAALVEKRNFMWLTSALADIKGGALRPQDAPSLPRGMGEMRLLQMGKKNKKSKKDVHAALRELFGLDEGCKLGWKKKTLTAAFPDDDAAAAGARTRS